MRKGIAFISTVLTAFVIVMIAGVVYAYQNRPAHAQTLQGGSGQQAVAVPLMAPAATQVANVSPQDAASIAAKYLNRTDLYSVELADFNGVQAYKVTFSSGDIIYVAMQGQVLGSVKPPAPVVVSSDPPRRHRGHGAGAPNGGEGEGKGEESEGGED